MNFIVRVIRYLFFLLMPHICASCKQFLPARSVLCISCKDRIVPIVSTTVSVTGLVSLRVFSVSEYKDPLKALILSKRRFDIVSSYQMGQLIWDMTPVQHVDFDYVVPIPLHWSRYAWRGFNQAEVIARVIAKKKRVSITNVLKRVKRTRFQSELAPNMRLENVKDAFVVSVSNNALYKDKHILLVDDLMTTGSTIKMAARELLKLKPKKITVVVVCRVI